MQISGGDVNTADLDQRYALRDYPDNTIRRIEALEAHLEIDNTSPENNKLNMSLRSTGNSSNLENAKRLTALEKGQADHTARIEELEQKCQNLQDTLLGAGNQADDGNSGQTDTQLRNKVNLLEKMLQQKADKTELQH